MLPYIFLLLELIRFRLRKLLTGARIGIRCIIQYLEHVRRNTCSRHLHRRAYYLDRKIVGMALYLSDFCSRRRGAARRNRCTRARRAENSPRTRRTAIVGDCRIAMLQHKYTHIHMVYWNIRQGTIIETGPATGFEYNKRTRHSSDTRIRNARQLYARYGHYLYLNGCLRLLLLLKTPDGACDGGNILSDPSFLRKTIAAASPTNRSE